MTELEFEGSKNLVEDPVEDTMIAKVLFDTIRNQVSCELRHIRYHDRPPLKFTALLADESRAATLVWCKELYEALLRAMGDAREDPWLCSYLTNMYFPQNLFVMETLTGLAETQFEHVPSDIREELVKLARNPSGSVVNENANRHLTSCSHDSPSGNLSRLSRWHRLLTSNLAEEVDRKLPPLDPDTHFVKAKTVNPCVFEPGSVINDFSLGADVLDAMESKAAPHLATAGYDSIPMKTDNIVTMAGRWDALKAGWLNLLVSPGTLLFHSFRGLKDAKWVIHACEDGCYAIHVLCRRIAHERRFVEIDVDSVNLWEHVTLETYEDWWATELRCAPPWEVREHLGRPDLAMQCGLIPDQPGERLLTFAAKRGFMHMKVPHLKKLFRMLKPHRKGPMPATEHGLATSCISHVLTDCSDADLQLALSWRNMKQKPVVDTILQEEDIPEAVEAFDEKEQADVEKALNEVVASKNQKLTPKAKARPSRNGGTSSGSSTGAAPSSLARQYICNCDLTAQDVRQAGVLPPVPGIYIFKDTKRLFRWMGTYPRDPPKQRTAAQQFNVSSEAGALMHVLKQLWEFHRQEGGGECPPEFVMP